MFVIPNKKLFRKKYFNYRKKHRKLITERNFRQLPLKDADKKIICYYLVFNIFI